MSSIFSNSMMWALQLALSLIFTIRGIRKILLSRDEIERSANWTKNYSSSLVKVVGLIEILAGIGLVLPFFLGLFFFIVPLAAIDLAAISAFTLFAYRRVVNEGMEGDRLRKAQFKMVLTGLYLLAALYIAVGRAWQLGVFG
jgi:uncharacterized membrane protein YphA (DoxX/SURF4 family)